MPIPLLLMAALGAGAGALLNPEDRKKGALLGGLLGASGGALSGAGATGGAASTAGGGLAANAAEIAAAQGAANVGTIGAAQQGAQAASIQAAQQAAAGNVTEQAAAQQLANQGNIGGALQTSGETIAAQPTLGERFAALQEDSKFKAGTKLLTQPQQQQAPPPPPAPLVQPGIRSPVQEVFDSGEPTFIPKGLFEADVSMRKKADDEEQTVQMLRARGLI